MLVTDFQTLAWISGPAPGGGGKGTRPREAKRLPRPSGRSRGAFHANLLLGQGSFLPGQMRGQVSRSCPAIQEGFEIHGEAHCGFPEAAGTGPGAPPCLRAPPRKPNGTQGPGCVGSGHGATSDLAPSKAWESHQGSFVMGTDTGNPTSKLTLLDQGRPLGKASEGCEPSVR